MSPLIAVIYLAVVIPLVLALATQADHRLLVALFLAWLMGYPVMAQEEFLPHIAV